MRLRGLPPLESEGATLLVLGSFPSASSLGEGRYYAFDRNHFWPLLAAVAAGREGAGIAPAPSTEAGRRDLLSRLSLSLWDLVASCEREGSLDKDIRDSEINPILTFVEERPSIEAIGLNGGAAARLFARRLLGGGDEARRLERAGLGEAVELPIAGRGIRVTRLPSTSPVPSARFRSMEDRIPLWRGFLEPEA